MLWWKLECGQMRLSLQCDHLNRGHLRTFYCSKSETAPLLIAKNLVCGPRRKVSYSFYQIFIFLPVNVRRLLESESAAENCVVNDNGENLTHFVREKGSRSP